MLRSHLEQSQDRFFLLSSQYTFNANNEERGRFLSQLTRILLKNGHLPGNNRIWFRYQKRYVFVLVLHMALKRKASNFSAKEFQTCIFMFCILI